MDGAGPSRPENGPGPWRALALLCVAQFMVILDGAIVNVALPSIQRDLHFSASSLQWVFTAYLLTYGGLLMLGGRTADLLGHRRMFMVGAALLGTASLAAGLSASRAELIGARALMGVGAAVITPAALSIILRTFSDGAERNRALGIWGAIVGLGAAVGVLLGGVITQTAGWQWVFFLNVPIAALVVAASRPLLPESRIGVAGRELDAAGGLSITAGLALLVYTIVRAPDVGWGAARTLVLLAVAIALIAAFVAIELRTRAPLVRMGLFRTATLAGANGVAFLFTGGFSAAIFVMTLYMQRALGYAAIKTGLAYLPLTGGMIVTATVAARLVTRCGVKLVLVVGGAATIPAFLILANASSTSTFAGTLLPAFLIMAAGFGASMVALSIAAFAGVGEADFGAASGLFNTSQQVGGALGVAVLSTVAYSHIRASSPSAIASGVRTVLGSAYADAFAAGTVFIAVALALSILVVRQREVQSWTCSAPIPSTTPVPPSVPPIASTPIAVEARRPGSGAMPDDSHRLPSSLRS